VTTRPQHEKERTAVGGAGPVVGLGGTAVLATRLKQVDHAWERRLQLLVAVSPRSVVTLCADANYQGNVHVVHR
jgi:hypothetical protein